jgi:aspartate aminotransferase-like enzyme
MWRDRQPKGLMLPPGLGFLAVSERLEADRLVRLAFLLLCPKAYRKSLVDSDTPYTPNNAMIRGLASRWA